jgi:hypothetical protein
MGCDLDAMISDICAENLNENYCHMKEMNI